MGAAVCLYTMMQRLKSLGIAWVYSAIAKNTPCGWTGFASRYKIVLRSNVAIGNKQQQPYILLLWAKLNTRHQSDQSSQVCSDWGLPMAQ
ncbi:hypothetical protein [Halomicronema sp. CCY15110]|uniref:hypothetical protein n=1 Tax=Halomicronema sp. CCY15110 TaxID=2767773 RepID=UPI001951714E|nr:hypothetical protein [Halomicronema sp. CCY15110]